MFACFGFKSSVMNLIYLKEFQFYYIWMAVDSFFISNQVENVRLRILGRVLPNQPKAAQFLYLLYSKIVLDLVLSLAGLGSFFQYMYELCSIIDWW